METLLELAKKFLSDNPLINEIELADGNGNKVHVVRSAPYVTYSYPITYQYSQQPQQYRTW